MTSRSPNLYEQVEQNLIDAVHSQKPNLPVVDEFKTGDMPSYPYFTYAPITDYIQLGFAENWNGLDGNLQFNPFELQYQIKAVSNSRAQAEGMNDWLRILFNRDDVANKMRNSGMVIERIEALPLLNNYLKIDYQFVAGSTLTIRVQPAYHE